MYTSIYLILLIILGIIFVSIYIVKYKKLPQSEYKAGAAWLRALIYFVICNIISVATGTFDYLIVTPIILPGQIADPYWWAFLTFCFVFIFFAYWIVWSRYTLTFERKYYLGSEIVFGLLWGLSMGQVLLSFYHLWKMTGFPIWGIYLCSYASMGLWQYFIQDYFWDIYVSPEHDTPRSIIIKTAVTHIPNVAICLLFLVLHGNYFIYILTQTFALVASSIFQKFPSPWAKEYFHAPMTKPGLLKLKHGAGYLGEVKTND